MPDMTQQAIMAEQLRKQAPAQEEGEALPEGCCCGQCPIAEQCMAAGGGPKTPEDAGGTMPGMGAGMKMGGVA